MISHTLCFKRFMSLRLKRSPAALRKVTKNTDLALAHFDGLYSKVYGKDWPSIRLGLLSTKKCCAVINTFVDAKPIEEELIETHGAISLKRYYDKHLHSYTRWQLKQQLLENKKARKRELIARNNQVSPESIPEESIEVSDISDSELRGAQTTDRSDGSFSSAEDLAAMFSDRRLDDDEKYFFNKASTQLSLEDFVPASEMIYKEDVYDDSQYYAHYNPEIEPMVEHRTEPPLVIDEQLRICTFPRKSWSTFDPPKKVDRADLLQYYLIDGASILPVLALDVKMNDVCADYCAAPGGKAIAMLMTLKPSHLLCNDSSISRLRRLSKFVDEFIPRISYRNETLKISQLNATKLRHFDTYDKILVDVPCSNDRNSVETLDNNIFKRMRTRERLELPSLQTDILRAAMLSLKEKGSLVYSTCTMSPLENDAVIHNALLQLQESGHPHKFAVMNLKEAFRPFRGLFKFKTNFKYGQQVVPSICSNFGPMYISKLKRIA